MVNFTIEQTKEMLGISTIPKAIFSSFLLQQLQHGLTIGNLDARAVVHTIEQIQSGKFSSKKGIRQFKCDALRGLSYAHWFEPRFIARNIKDYLKLDSQKSNKFGEIFAKACKKSGVKKGEFITKEVIAYLSHYIMEGYEQKAKSHSLTGEWIIFFEDKNVNVYLSLASHAESDFDIYMRMAAKCGEEYPVLFPKEKIERLHAAMSERIQNFSGENRI